MANNKSIQILRGTSANIVAANSSTTLLAGQPLYNTDKNYLTIGATDGDALTKKPIAARELVGYLSDTDDNIAGTSTLEMYRISGNSQGAMNITAQGIINMAGQSYNIIAKAGSMTLSGGTAGVIQTNLSNGMSINSSYNINISSSNISLYTNGKISLTSTGAGITEYANTGPISITCAAPGASGGIRLNGVGCDVNVNANDISLSALSGNIRASASNFYLTAPSGTYIHSQLNSIILSSGNVSVEIAQNKGNKYYVVFKQNASSSAVPNFITRYPVDIYSAANRKGLLVANMFSESNPSGGAPLNVGSNIEAYTPSSGSIIRYDINQGGIVGAQLCEYSIRINSTQMGNNTAAISCNFNCISFQSLTNSNASGQNNAVIANFLYSLGYNTMSTAVNASGTYINGTVYNQIQKIYAPSRVAVACVLNNGTNVMPNIYSPGVWILSRRQIV